MQISAMTSSLWKSQFSRFLEYVFVLKDIYMKNNTYKLHIWTTLAIKGSYFIKSRYLEFFVNHVTMTSFEICTINECTIYIENSTLFLKETCFLRTIIMKFGIKIKHNMLSSNPLKKIKKM